MSKPTNVVRCPRCHHPYPMTDVQREVYRGRTMGCMNCGRPFKVPDAAPPAAAVPEVQPGAFAPMDAAAMAGPDDTTSTTTTTTTPSAEPGGTTQRLQTPSSRRNGWAFVSVGFGVMFFLLIASVALAGLAFGSASDGQGGNASADHVLKSLSYAALASAASALLVGVVGLLRARPPERAGRGYAIAGMSLGGGGLFISGCLLAVLMPSINRQREQDNREVCVARLQQVGYALNAHASTDPQQRYPDALEALVLSGQVPADALICPGSTDTPAPGVTRNEQAAAIVQQPGHLSYVYTGRMQTLGPGALADTVLAYETPGHHSDGIHVLFLDGTVAFVNKLHVPQLVAEINAGQNPVAHRDRRTAVSAASARAGINA